MNKHDKYSLLLHSEVRSLLLRAPDEILRIARANIAKRRASKTHDSKWIEMWATIIDGDMKSLAAVLIEESDCAQALRSCSPFAGAITEKRRLELHRAIEG